jgi:hypothetical protein
MLRESLPLILIAAIVVSGCGRAEKSNPVSKTFPPAGEPPRAVLSGTRHVDGDMAAGTFEPTPLPE